MMYLVGIFLVILSMIYFAITPLDKPVTIGIYRYSRNPMFLGFFIIYLGISIACLSWTYFLLTLLFIILVYYASPFEERATLDHYGDGYKEYMKSTAKWIGIPKK